MDIRFSCNIDIDLKSPNLKEILKNFCTLLQILLQQFFQQALHEFADYYMGRVKKPFSCDKCGNNQRFIWKTHHGKKTSIVTIFGLLNIFQLQVQCKECNHKMYLTRKLLGISARKRVPLETIRKLGLIGALTTFRVAKKIVGMFGVDLDKMTLWRSVQKLSEEVEFGLDPEELASGEADGTGIPIRGIKKRGKERLISQQRLSG